MRLKIFVPFLGFALLASTALSARAQDEEELVRGSFLTTRVTASTGSGNATSAAISASASKAAGNTSSNKPTSSTTSVKSTGKKPTGKTGTRVNASGKVSSGKTSTTVKGNASVNTNGSAETYSPGALGLGYTLYMRNEDGSAMRVDPSREFRAGDRIRISLETNSDGYLYIFHTENDGLPQMLYPDTRLERGGNRVEAHVPYEIPWNEPGVENWFRFDANPANERLYIVLTREPLPGVPTSTALVDYCGKNRCPWQPPTEVWAQLKASGQAKVGVVKSRSYGQKQTQAEQVAVTRGLGLDQSAPEPSVIRMNASSNLPILVTAVDLIHR